MAFENETDQTYIVLTNAEGQHSLWPKRNAVPAGWSPDGFEGSQADCARHVDEVWLDMRPASLLSQES
jgi:MbtH protein